MPPTSIARTLLVALGVWLVAPFAASQEPPADGPAKGNDLSLAYAVLCESIADFSPHHPAVVFSIAAGKVSCFTTFDPVPAKTYVEHRWYFKDGLSAKKKLFLKNPRWSTYSSIQLREADKGPWRVEVVDEANRTLGILRFSVTD